MGGGPAPDERFPTTVLRHRTTRIRTSLAAATAASALIAAAPLLAVPADAVVARPSACADVLLLGARGSGQWAEGYDQNRGYGPQVRIAVDRMSEELRAEGVRVSAEPLDYPAESMATLAKNPSKYWAGVEAGVAQVQRRVADHVAACPDAAIVLLGYSQGAMVMHRVLQRGVDDLDTRTWLGSAVLIADSDRVAYDRTTNHGTASAGTTGLAQRAAVQSGSSSAKLEPWAEPLVHSICNSGDSSCGDGVDNRVHTRYKGTPEVVEALRESVGRLAGS